MEYFAWSVLSLNHVHNSLSTAYNIATYAASPIECRICMPLNNKHNFRLQARFWHWQMMASYTKPQGTPRRQPKQCNSWTAYPSGVTTPELSSVQTRRKHCGECLTTEQQENQCQRSHLKELFVKRTSHLRPFGIHFDWMLTYRKHVSAGNTSTEVQERSVSPEGYGCSIKVWCSLSLTMD